jgi:hypothetical protein
MKPMSPEDRELEEMGRDVSARYRADAADAQPSARVDAAILEAARREAGRGRMTRGWRVPAAVAAVLVIGVTLSLNIRDEMDSLPPPAERATVPSEMAAARAPSLAQEAAPAAKRKLEMETRPSRERSERKARDEEPRPDGSQFAAAPATDAMSSGAPAVPAPAPEVAAVDRAPQAEEAPRQGQRNEAEMADAAKESAASALRKSAPTTVRAQAAPTPQAAIEAIEKLLAEGRESEARASLVEFRKRFPDYRLPEKLQALLPAAPAQ